MEFSSATRTSGKVTILDIKGHIDAHSAPQFEEALSAELAKGNARLVVNFSELEYISSAGLGVFMAHIDDAREKGGDIKLCAMTPKVQNVFDLVGFPMLFTITADESGAIASFSHRKK